MAVTDGRATLVVTSTVRTGAWLASRLGVDEVDWWEAGDLRGSGRGGHRHREAGWALDAEVPGSPEPFDAAVRRLLAALAASGVAPEELAESCHVRVLCSGSSDSVQGGFSLSQESIEGLGRVGAELLVTVWMPEGDDGTV